MAKFTQQELEAHLWGSANILRGKTAGQDYKTYILSLMFFKRLTERLRLRGKEMRQRPCRVFIMGQRTKWGGCSRLWNLSFNWRLVMAPPEVLDYIVVHELGHLAEPYHSTKFRLIVRSYCPNYDRHRRWLGEHEDLLMGREAASRDSGDGQHARPGANAWARQKAAGPAVQTRRVGPLAKGQ